MERNLKNGIELMWTGKERAISEARKPATHILKHVHSGSMLGVKFNHLFIEGDNLEALKILQSNYLEKIHQIYIDPPYNTGQLFVYNDKFDNQEDWLNMMLPRLIIARQLLKDDGVIFVSIDDHELANLKILMDETFGKENYIEIFSWVKSETPANLARKSKKVVEYVLCYQKKNNKNKFKGIKKYSPSSNGLLNQSNKKGVLVFPANIVHTKIKDGIIKAGKYGTDRYDIDLLEDTIVQSGYFNKEIILQAKFKWTQSKLEREIQKGTKISIPTLRLSPSYDKTSYDPEVPPNLINHKVGVVTNEVASTNLTKLMGAKVFDFPKPISLLKYLLSFNDDKEGIILDFFAGSAATMQAVMEMNLDDGGNRKCICIQLDENIATESIAYENGYKTISQIGIERVNRFLAQQNPIGIQPLEGIKVFQLQNSNFNFNAALKIAAQKATAMVGHGLYSRFGLSETQRMDKALLGCLGELAFEGLLKRHGISYQLDHTNFEYYNKDKFDFLIDGKKIDVKVAKKSTKSKPTDSWTYGYPQDQRPESKDYIVVGWVDFENETVEFYGWIPGKTVAQKKIVEKNTYAGFNYLTPNHEFNWGDLNKNMDQLFTNTIKIKESSNG